MTPAGPNRLGPSARRAHRQACARSANSVRCSGLTPKVLKPTITAGVRAFFLTAGVTYWATANRGPSVVQPVALSARRTGSYSVKAEVKVSAQRDAWPGQPRR